jgi:pimeloyl-ACP methyl ester carboxylesterase
MSADRPPTLPLAFPALPELRSTTVFGNAVRYYDIGSGPPLLLIHGIGGDADEWAFCFEALSKFRRVIALDQLGFGRSDKPRIRYTIAAFVEQVHGLLRNLEIDRATLVGNSLGGWIAASFALRFPQAVDRLVLVDSAGAWGDATPLPIDLRVSTYEHLREIFNLVFYDHSLVKNELVQLAYQQHLQRGDSATIDSVLRELASDHERLDDTVGALQIPTLIVWGEQDAMIPLEIGQRLHRLIPGSKLAVIPECGHLPALEKPAEFVRSVLEFLL